MVVFQYGIDIIFEKDGEVLYMDGEQKTHWNNCVFPFPTLHIPGRKIKWAKEDTWFAVVSNDRKKVALVRGDVAAQHTIRKNTIYTEDEIFMEVPMSKVRICQLEVG